MLFALFALVDDCARKNEKSEPDGGGKAQIVQCEIHIEIFRNYCATGIAICIVVIYGCLLQNDKKGKKSK